ncbi:hypothetical protein RHSIM_Rhsim10G0131700 [Rhododendron simsii]|uniref:Uncharacterized protein n=1 Tax=Rhododendron simsii TaxID=118357 RepID=A0A834L9G3_RHOSS|nr:hypothetical protein RHSIM_Rhsim10G0131700 [Rhododendron simsii]
MKWLTCERWSCYFDPNSPLCISPHTCKAVLSLQDDVFEAKMEALDPEFGSYKPAKEEDDAAGDSDENSDDRSDAATDASDGANSGDGDHPETN